MRTAELQLDTERLFEALDRCLGGWRARARPRVSASRRLRCGLLRLAGRGLQTDWRDAESDSARVPRRRHAGAVFPRQRDPVGGGAARCRCRCRDERAGGVARRGAVARRVPADGGVGVSTMKHRVFGRRSRAPFRSGEGHVRRRCGQGHDTIFSHNPSPGFHRSSGLSGAPEWKSAPDLQCQ
jgi:hypothetical protein